MSADRSKIIQKSGKPTQRLVYVAAEPRLVERLEDFRFSNRFSTNAKAIRALLEYALEHHPLIKLKKGAL